MDNQINIKVDKEDCFFILGFLKESTELMRENYLPQNDVSDDIKISKIEILKEYRKWLLTQINMESFPLN